MVSLTLQDVRAWAHGLVLEMTEHGVSAPATWPDLTEAYFGRFDKGKPRKPTRLQRLIEAWSADQSWRGLLRACQRQSQLWLELETALKHDGGLAEEPLLRLALICHQVGCWTPWREEYAEKWADLPTPCRRNGLELLGLLVEPCHQERADFLCSLDPEPDLYPALVRAALVGRTLRPEQKAQLCARLLNALEVSPLPPEASDLVLFRYLGRGPELSASVARIAQRDPRLAEVRYGPRPGRLWLEELLSELR